MMPAEPENTQKCLNCGKTIEPGPWSKHKVYCNMKCRRELHRKKSGVIQNGLSTGNVGAIAELIVCADLLYRGYAVFHSVSQSASCDLIIMKNGKMQRVEVTTGYRCKSGKLQYPPHKESNYDILCIIIKNKNEDIIYLPANAL